MRVLGLCADPGVPLDGTKGASVHLRAIWTALARTGCEVDGIAPWRGGPLPAPPRGLRLHPVGASRATSLASALLAAAGPIVADAVLERLALGSDAGLEIARARDIPLVVEVNAPLDEEAARFRTTPDAGSIERLERTLAGADIVQVVSSELVPWARARGARDVRVLPNGVDLAAFEAARASGAADARESAYGRPHRVRVVFAGSFKPWHGLDVLLEAFATAVRAGADLELELLGDGPGRQAAIERSAALGIAALTAFPGALPHEAIPARLLAAEIAVAPAPANAPPYLSALKLREYAAAGCAIIAASLPQVSGQFRHGHDALLVAPGDTDALAGAIASLARDAPLRRRLGDAAAARAAEFDWAHVALRLREWMEVLAHERTRP